MPDLGGLVDLSQRCSSPVFVLFVFPETFVLPREDFGDSLRGHRPCYPYCLGQHWIWEGELESFQAPGPVNGWGGPHCYQSATPREWQYLLYPYFLRPLSNVWNIWVGDVIYSGHSVRFEHVSSPDTSVGGLFSPVPTNLPTVEALSTHSLWNVRSLDMDTPKP
jgi:hypothetical protein